MIATEAAARRAAVLLVCAWVVAAGPLASVAHAQPEARTDPIAAEALFQHGKDLMDQARIPEACRAFAESQRLDPAGGTLLRLGLCHEADKKLASAWVEYLEVMRMSQEGGGDPAKLAERVRIVREHLDRIDARVPKLVVAVPLASRVDGLEVTVNGQSRAEGSWGVAIPIDPGEVRIVATAPAKRAFQVVLQVEEGGRPEVELPPLQGESAPAAALVEHPATPRDKNGLGLASLGLGVGGLGLAALGVGTYFGVRAISKWNDSNAVCPGTECGASAVSLAHDARQSATIADVTLAAGAATLAAGVVLLLVGAPKGGPVRGTSIAVAF